MGNLNDFHNTAIVFNNVGSNNLPLAVLLVESALASGLFATIVPD